MILEIRKFGDPVLRGKAKRIEKIDETVIKLLDDMVDTMRDVEGIGLAGPQVGENLRLFVVEDKPGIVRKVINPEFLEHQSEEAENEEGCLSVPGIHKKVKRKKEIKIQYQNEKGETIVEVASGLLGRAFQHEFDHLEGELFVDKVSTISKRLITKKLQAMKKKTLKEIELKRG